MRIFVVPRRMIETRLAEVKDYYTGRWFISIFDSGSSSPFTMDRHNILKLRFDDVTEKDTDPGLVHFNSDMAQKIMDFIKPIRADDRRDFIVHCAAGVSRSGAVGYMLNEWFNKYLTVNKLDNEAFIMDNQHIQPNPEVIRVLKRTMFGEPIGAFW